MKKEMQGVTEKCVYDVNDVQQMLGIGRTTAYTFIRNVYEQGIPFKVVKVCDSYRIHKKSFDNWLNENI